MGVILENSFGLVVDVSLRFYFLNTNNQAKYEAVIVGMNLAKEM